MLPIPLVKRLEPLDNIENVLMDELARYRKFDVHIDVEYMDELKKPLNVMVGQFMDGGDMKLVEAMYLNDSNEAYDHPPITVQYEQGSTKFISPLYIIDMYGGVLITKQYTINLTNRSASLDGVKILMVGKKFEKLRDKVRTAKDQPERKPQQTYTI
ncbi:hypothetical protein GCM10007981_04100 [Thermocladium modestius]|uniref:Uncharacterized protein n=1 Tax=Thermocladium modestius TaxID=62609 RepID=A0A830GSK8_9CREN|nr:hypothetical protein [Thermocladium modestius]GGP19633.1 hypothetical protein GCM10007981_04100 [Thermocladium modestius]